MFSQHHFHQDALPFPQQYLQVIAGVVFVIFDTKHSDNDALQQWDQPACLPAFVDGFVEYLSGPSQFAEIGGRQRVVVCNLDAGR